jgi:hypothetical protein
MPRRKIGVSKSVPGSIAAAIAAYYDDCAHGGWVQQQDA